MGWALFDNVQKAGDRMKIIQKWLSSPLEQTDESGQPQCNVSKYFYWKENVADFSLLKLVIRGYFRQVHR